MKKVAAESVPWVLTENQKECQNEACVFNHLDADPDFLPKIVSVMNHGVRQNLNNEIHMPNKICASKVM